MKSLFKILIFSIVAVSSAQENDTSIFNFNASYTGDLVNVISGGIKKGSCYMGLLNLEASLKTGKERFFKRGMFVIRSQATHGANASTDYIGDCQVLSNIDNGNHIYLFEFFYSYSGERFTLKTGLTDLNADFSSGNQTSTFINSSFGIIPTLSMNMPVSIFPKTSMSISAQYKLKNNLLIKGALYDGDPGSLDNDPHNLNWSFSKKQGYFLIGELQYFTGSDNNREGIYSLGAYFYNGNTIDYKAINNLPSEISGSEEFQFLYTKGNSGLYGSFETNIWKDGKRKQGIFLTAGWSPSHKNMLGHFISAGTTFSGILKSRPQDILGLGIAHTGFGEYHADIFSTGKKHETAIELTYLTRLGEHFIIQPDIHYIINPGMNEQLRNAFVFTLRTTIEF